MKGKEGGEREQDVYEVGRKVRRGSGRWRVEGWMNTVEENTRKVDTGQITKGLIQRRM